MSRKLRGPKEPYAVVKLEVTATVELPESDKYNGQMCEDPAIEAALEALGQGPIDIYLWGQAKDPARVYLETYEEDAEVEEDGR
jgi:hypothetical protein